VASGEVEIAELTAADISRASEIVATYADMRLGFVDAFVIALAERLDVKQIATVDRRHFAAENAPDVVRGSGSGAEDKCAHGDSELARMIYRAYVGDRLPVAPDDLRLKTLGSVREVDAPTVLRGDPVSGDLWH
jgi:hypothetical protein